MESYKDKYRTLNLEEVTRLDEKEKALKSLANGLIGKIVAAETPDNKKDNVVEMPKSMDKAVNE